MTRLKKFLLVLALATLVQGCGDADVQFSRGLQAYDLGDHAKAMSYWVPLAETGHPRAQYSLGILYFKGEGVEQDYDRAFSYFQSAADAGAFGAPLSLCVMYANGFGVEADPIEAYKWARIADNNKNGEAPQWRATLQRQLTAEQIKEAEDRAAAWKPAG
jgi:TPR repeat protein